MARVAITRSTGLTERAILRYLSGGEFRGSVWRLQQLTKTQYRFVWQAVAGLAADNLIEAHKALDGDLTLRITHAGKRLSDSLKPTWRQPGRFSR